MTDERFTRRGFLKTYALPVFFVLLVPGVGVWFAGHAASRMETGVHTALGRQVEQDPQIRPEDKPRALAYVKALSLASICAAAKENDTNFSGVCGEYRQFQWLRALSLTSIAVGLFAFVFASICVALSLRSQPALYASFVAGWNVLKIAALLQAVLQGTIAVMLSYWMTVVWFNRYVPKLILMAGLGAVVVVWLIIKAIFRRIGGEAELEGTLITETMAPRFWVHVREMCRTLGTEPPQQIVAGIDDNFFVTEHPVRLQGAVMHGRTLFVSLSLLKVLEKEEADGVLAHEMAHFSGDDTLYTRKMSPLLARYGEYLNALTAGGWLARPLLHFMLFFRTLFQLSISRQSRQREFRADSIAASTTSSAAMGRALIKTMAYSSYRARIEQALFSQDAREERLGIAGRVSSGFASYVGSPSLLGDLSGAHFPHPFDTHPLLDSRLAAIKAPIVPSHYAGLLTAPVAESWLVDINGVDEIERQMWTAYEQRFAAAHEEALAWRCVPSNSEERAIVEKYFPSLQIATKKSDGTIDLDFTQVRFSEWTAPVGYGDISNCSIRESLGRKFLTIKLHSDRKKVEVPLHRFEHGQGVVDLIQRYSARHAVMTQRHAQTEG